MQAVGAHLPLADAALDLSRWQFALTTIYHFIFVPLTIGLAYTLAVMQTIWWRTGDEQWLRLTRFFGKLFLINFAIGVATGLVQEFQFGMNWSEYSRFVGDVFGAPLAMEGLLAFFLEATFIGLWVFGWNRLKPRIHLATIWLVAIGTTLSAYFILAANAWMQQPLGYEMVDGHAQMTNVFAVLFNETALLAFFHTATAAAVTASLFVLGVCAFHIRRGQDVAAFTRAAKVGAAIAVPATLLVFLIGDEFMRNMYERQPMKVAAAEALFDTGDKVGLSLFAVAPLEANPGDTTINIQIPYLLSILATNTFDGQVTGINQIQKEYEERYGPGDYVPPVGVVYWGFRGMVVHRRAHARPLAVGGLARVEGQAPHLQAVPEGRDLVDTAAVPREHRGLGVHGGRASALGGAGPAEDRGRRQRRRCRRGRSRPASSRSSPSTRSSS